MKATVGVGFKPEHFQEAVASPAEGLWFEVHAENYMVDGGPRLAMLEALRAEKPLSLHGVGLSLAGVEWPDPQHLARLKELANRFQPFLISEHLAWSRLGEISFPDLLPFPRTTKMLDLIVRNIRITQDALRRSILIENPSLYIDLDGHEWSETEFLKELVRRSGCTLLLDVNNVHVSASNLGFDPKKYIELIPPLAVTEIHLAGYSSDPTLGPSLLIDSHDQPIGDSVWELYAYAIGRMGPRPTLIERDGNVPPFDELMAERDRAVAILRPRAELADA
ncbi:DUF692 domain-containing protein [Sphingomonas sp.]|uniref:MNIO family bufferin maturase n=1 Tax=Sphingomonas sp. TaxID=28214 RepID=UPI00180A6D22|nr:DUF692 domain-containing protein [Sphingomonas sp.]MBA3511132.1 DUF692 domain-containing protein [Sphingomonas sp.]